MSDDRRRRIEQAIDPRLRASVTRFDRRVDTAFDRLRGNPVADRVFYTASELGDYSLLWHLLGAAKGLGPQGVGATARLGAALGVESALVNGLLKSMLPRVRPEVDPASRPLRLRLPRSASFPSGHASSATMAAVILSDGSRLAPVYTAVAVAVALSRIHVRIHHASDVVGGVVVGAALGCAVRRWLPLGRGRGRLHVR